ncbi:carbonic anhydrase [Aurantiacibacter xanthus]|uniref:Carbonic anhydrase n=1 Tax=Aurantiacibacter xanthus TaxID=1784712 RepID=A0A3A1P5E4_9SPHN|nr:carbonic anhydrase [Aurantiacibacter xanthus]RIV88154.1 carbonic anhydrase [Aurantiacibacter xanthus]
MKKFRELLLANKAWSHEMRERKPDFFGQQMRGQNPDILWIGCSDSRVSPEQITQTRPGELFIHRNVANVVSEDDDNFGSVLQFAVEELKVSHIVICGHRGCGVVEASVSGETTGAIDRWLGSVREVSLRHAEELAAISDQEERLDRLVELNVRHQVRQLARMRILRAAFERGEDIALHGLVYDLHTGLARELDIESDLIPA